MSFPMEQCDVSLMSGIGVAPISLPGKKGGSPCWYGQDLFPGRGYSAAVSVEGSDWDLSCWEYVYEA